MGFLGLQPYRRVMTEDATPTRPTLAQALRSVIRADPGESFELKRVEINVLATGEVVYRIYPRDDEEYISGVVLADS
jgi:hypothetical protein